MHLSSRLPKKNYESILTGGYSSEERKVVGGSNFKNAAHKHNTMGKKQSIREIESPSSQQMEGRKRSRENLQSVT